MTLASTISRMISKMISPAVLSQNPYQLYLACQAFITHKRRMAIQWRQIYFTQNELEYRKGATRGDHRANTNVHNNA
jgi:hypothetical protein